MESIVKEKMAKILDLSQKIQMLMGENDNVVQALNALNEHQLTEIWKKLNTNPHQEKINKVRLLVIKHLLEKGKITNYEIKAIKDDVAKEYPDKKIFQSWDSYFRLFLPILYRDKIKIDLENIAGNIIDSLSLRGLVKYKVVDFDGATNLGLDRSWIAIYNKNQPNQKVSYQLYISLNGQVISYGLNRHMDKKSTNDTDFRKVNLNEFNYSEMISFLDKHKQIIIDDVYFKRYWKFSPGEKACYWEEMKAKNIAAIGWGNHDYSTTEDIEQIRELAPEFFKEKSGANSPGIISSFVNANVGDVIYAFEGLEKVVGYGQIKKVSDYSEISLIKNADYHNYLTIEWIQFDQPVYLDKDKQTSRYTFVDVTKRDDIISEIEKHISGKRDATVMNFEQQTPSIKFIALNQILYGPPGTGKTYNTVSETLRIFDIKAINDIVDEKKLEAGLVDKQKFDVLKLKRHIEFVTFHQSFSYEDFVEGIRAETNDKGGLSYSIKDGIFKKIAIEALFSKFEDLFNDQLPEKWQAAKDKAVLSKQKTTDINTDKVFDPTNYEHKKLILSACTLADFKNAKGKGKPYVLIIDEINRGNTSRVFGELITLIETTKRAGTDEAMDAILPYSQETFTVPDNLYIIGTMNTADRSLALMDTALRRRFDFIEMMPDPYLIKGVDEKPLDIDGIKIQEMLRAINDRIEALYDREHTIGHAFFMKLTSGSKVSDLALIFKNNILPLLEEYFFEDWEKITKVLGKSNIYIKKNFDNLGFDYLGTNYSRNDSALENKDTYINIYKLKDIDPDQAQ